MTKGLDGLLPTEHRRDLRKGVRGINKQGLHFILDRHILRRRDWLASDSAYSRGDFKVSIVDPDTSFDFMANGIDIKLGHHTIITAQPTVFESDEGVKSVSLEKRQCFFQDEEPTKIFKRYTEAGCKYECMLAFATSKCACTPWDHPRVNDNVTDICDWLGYYCVNSLMDNTGLAKDHCGHCLDACSLTEYANKVEVEPLEVETLCENYVGSSELFKYLSRDWAYSRTRDLETYWSIMHGLERGPTCHESLQDVAMVTVQLGNNGYAKSERKVRVSLTEKIASFGQLT